MKKLLIVSFFIICCSCVEWTPCSTYSWTIDSDYSFHPQYTSGGIKYDFDNQDIDSAKIDQVFESVYTCLETVFPDGAITEEVSNKAWCYNLDYNYKPRQLCKDCLKIKIPNNWEVSCSDSNEQVLQDEAPQSLCDEKHLNNNCECRWRSAITDNNIIVTTPNMRLLPDALVRYTTGCHSPWLSPILEPCLKPLW